MFVSAEKPEARSRRVRLLALAAVLSLATLTGASPAQADPASDAGVSVAMLNDTRAAHGLHGLMPDAELQQIANRQANAMAESGAVWHTANLGSQLSWGWWAWSENVGYGPSVGWLHGAFMNSWSHSENVLNPSYNYVGVGVAYGWDGSIYVSHVFGAW
jgi:uncharacterized protein YkwD